MAFAGAKGRRVTHVIRMDARCGLVNALNACNCLRLLDAPAP